MGGSIGSNSILSSTTSFQFPLTPKSFIKPMLSYSLFTHNFRTFAYLFNLFGEGIVLIGGLYICSRG